VYRTWNPPNRFDPVEIEWDEEPPVAELQVVEDDSKGILSHNDSPDLGFDWSVNPYRGCTHACAYCYARGYHEYLGWGAGSDFERRIVVKLNAAGLLRARFDEPRWSGELIAFSGVTDCYQALERRYRLTRGCLEVCAEYQNPVSVVTRSPLVTRDIDLLRILAEHGAVGVTFSLPLLDREVQKALEPGAPAPEARLRAMSALSEAGIPVGVSLGPVIPGLSDREIPTILERARACGARWAWRGLIRLPGPVASVFETRLREVLPGRAESVLARIDRMRGGKRNEPRFSARMEGRGEDPSWQAVEQLFRKTPIGSATARSGPRRGRARSGARANSSVCSGTNRGCRPAGTRPSDPTGPAGGTAARTARTARRRGSARP
jgi:DNA repair photolyase